MFKTIVEHISQNNLFQNKGIYLENRANYWLTIIPKNKGIVIQWKNGGFKKRHLVIKNIEESKALFEEWKEEIEKSNTDSNNLLEIFNKNRKYFIEKMILGQREFKKNIRAFEVTITEKIKESNESFNSEDNFLSYIAMYFFVKQFRLKIEMENYKFTNPFRQEIVIFKKNEEKEIIRTPLEFKLILESNLSQEEKQFLKENFSKKVKEYLSHYVDLEYTGINRLLNKFKA